MNFTVTVSSSGRQFEVARDEVMLPAAIRQGIGLPYGCKDGACGSCKSRLLEGRVIHGAHQLKALSAAEEEAGVSEPRRHARPTASSSRARSRPPTSSPVLKMPTRATSIQRPAADVAVLKLQLPATSPSSTTPASTSSPPRYGAVAQLLDGECARAGTGRHGAAHPPHAGRALHRLMSSAR